MTSRFSNQKLFEFLDKNKDNKIIKKEFFDKTADSGFTNCNRDELNETFQYIDSNNNGVISLKEFKHYFYDREFLEQEAANSGTELDDELKLLFRRLDYNQTGFIHCEEFVRCLNLLGYPATPEMVEVEFKEFDYNKDSRMDFAEFRRFMHSKMRKTMFRMDNTLDDVKRKFKKVHPTDGSLYDYIQFATGISACAPDITPEEAEALFFEIDQDREGVVSLDEIVEFMKKPADDSETPMISNAILKIKKSQVLPIKDLIDIYEYVPKNFCTSFTRMNYLEMKSLPCESLYPKLLGNTLGFSELYGEYTDPKTGNFYPAKPLPVRYLKQICLTLATGVPIPEETKLNRLEQIKKREIRAVLFDRETHKFVGGTLTIPVNWARSYEDRWEFNNPEKNACFYIRAPDENNSLCIVFEFVMTVIYKNVELQMSCCWSAIDLVNLGKPGNQELPLFGGAPNFSTQINNSDVRTGRTTLFGKIGKFFGGNIKSKLNMKLMNTEKLKLPTREALDQLPKTILVPTESLYFWRAFRTYLGKNCYTGEGLNSSLQTDIAVKSFCRIVNLPSFNQKASHLWNTVAEPRFAIKKSQRPDYDSIERVFEESMNITHPVFEGEHFHYNKTDQTLEACQEPEKSSRETLIEGALQRIKNVVEGSLINLDHADLKYDRAFDIEELLEDEFEAIGGGA